MKCSRCNTDNPEGAKFCMNCAAPLVRVCPTCGTELPPAARFCFNCAAPVTVAPPTTEPEPDPRLQRLVPKEYAERLLATSGQVQPERRTVTILFSDVKGSTAMAEKLDPEDVKEIMDGAFEFLIAPIYRYEGTLARLMGDAVLAFFGAPIAHEDDPERACRAALEITAEAQRYAEKLEKERGIKGFGVRVGINTGLVVVGEVGSDLRVEYTAMGDAINLAARMESAAEPGTVLITANTHKLIAPLFETRALGPLQVKGKAEPVLAYRVLAAKAVAGKVRGVAGLESPLVGREVEFTALHEAIERLRAGVGGIVTIVGEAGLGKSRLMAEVRRAYSCTPLQWAEGRCVSYGTSVAYLLWLDILRAVLGVTAEEAPLAVRDRLREWVQSLCRLRGTDRSDEVYPFLARLMSLPLEAEDEAVFRNLEGEKLKAGTFRAVQALMEGMANDRPLVLVCEDLHWADPTSVELLEQVLALTDRAALLLVCLFRPERDRPTWRIKETAARFYPHRHTDLLLNPLSAVESQALVGNLLQIEDLPARLKERILQATEGNPFYVEEVLRSLIDHGAIVRDAVAGRWTAMRDVTDITIPMTLQGVLMARMDHLQEETRRVLQLASVIGRTFLYRVLAAIAQEEQRLDQHLVALQREQMIRERARIPELEYIFKHELTREAAYNGLLKKERQAFHRQVAEALESLFPDRVDEQVELLAHHWERAGVNDKAVTYLIRAADRARRNYACTEAIHHCTLALGLAEQAETADKEALVASILKRRGEAYSAIADMGAARQDLYRVLAWSRKTGDRHEEAETLLCLLEPLTVGHELDEAMACAQGAYSIAVALQDNLLIARSTGALGGALSMRGELDKAQPYLKTALAASRKHGATESLAEALSSYMMERYWVGDFRGALAATEEAMALAERVRNPRWTYSALLTAGMAHCGLGNYDLALEMLVRTEEVAKRAQMPNAPAELPNFFGWVYQEVHNLAKSVPFNQKGAEVARELGEIESEANALVNLGVDHLWLKDLRQAEACFEAALALLDKQFGGFRWRWKTRLLAAWGELCLVRGEASRALEYAEQCLQSAQATSAKKNLVKGWTLEGKALVALDRPEQAVSILSQAVAMAKELGNPPLLWTSCFAHGRVLECLGRQSEARERYGLAAATIRRTAANLGDPTMREAFLSAEWVRAVLVADASE